MTLHPRSACLIIDDPRLTSTYGCLNYSDLLDRMERQNFFTEIAFIPFNWRFNGRKTVRLFAENPHRFGLCVHGYSHLGNEFGGTDYDHLRRISESALYKMEKFQQRTGLGYDRVMVFPQGKFSTVAMRALRDVGFHAAFNSTIIPRDAIQPLDGEYYKPYTDHWGLPLFLRRYPVDRCGLLQDFKHGRPIILVEHHAALRKNELFDCIDWINSLGPIMWKPLSSIVSEHCPQCAITPSIKLTAPVSFKSVARRVACEIRDNIVTPIAQRIQSTS